MDNDVKKWIEKQKEWRESGKPDPLQMDTPPAGYYDKDYFFNYGEKNMGYPGEGYTEKMRRRYEAINPRMTRWVFGRCRVLDCGCGTGAFVRFLCEEGMDAYGIDISEFAIQWGYRQNESVWIVPRTKSLYKRLAVASITDIPYPNRSFDLVHSKGVLEHLSIEDGLLAVKEMCRVSRKWIYVVASMNLESNEIISELDHDLSHIVLAPRGYWVRLFRSYGFWESPDLENILDWQGRGLVMVFERRRALWQLFHPRKEKRFFARQI